MKEQKKKYLSFMTDFQDLTATFHVSEDLFKELSSKGSFSSKREGYAVTIL